MNIEQAILHFKGGALEIARKSRSLSQSQLSKKTEIPQGILSKLENGYMRPSIHHLEKLCSVLEYKPKFFTFIEFERCYRVPIMSFHERIY